MLVIEIKFVLIVHMIFEESIKVKVPVKVLRTVKGKLIVETIPGLLGPY